MTRKPRHFWKGSLTALAVVSLALPPALAAMSRSERIRDTALSETLLGQFTPASGDPRLIARGFVRVGIEPILQIRCNMVEICKVTGRTSPTNGERPFNNIR